MIRTITITEIGLPEAIFKGRNAFGDKVVKPVLKQLVRYWHKFFLPRHFAEGAQARYHYRRRSEQYKRRKRILAGALGRAAAPLVFTGRLKREVSRTIKVKGTGKRAQGVMTGPRYMSKFYAGGDRPNIAGELTKQTKAEMNEQAQRAERLALALINSDRTRVRHRIAS